MNFLRVVAHTSWGGDQQTLLAPPLPKSHQIVTCLRLYCIWFERNSYLRMLEPIQNHALDYVVIADCSNTNLSALCTLTLYFISPFVILILCFIECTVMCVAYAF